MPFFRGVLWKIDKLLLLAFLRSPNERDKVSVKGSCVDAIAFGSKADRASLQIDEGN